MSVSLGLAYVKVTVGRVSSDVNHCGLASCQRSLNGRCHQVSVSLWSGMSVVTWQMSSSVSNHCGLADVSGHHGKSSRCQSPWSGKCQWSPWQMSSDVSVTRGLATWSPWQDHQMSVITVVWQMSVVHLADVSSDGQCHCGLVRCQWSLWPGIGNWEANSLTLVLSWLHWCPLPTRQWPGPTY